MRIPLHIIALSVPRLINTRMLLALVVFFLFLYSSQNAQAATNLTGNTSCLGSAVFNNSITPLAMYCLKRSLGIAIEIYYEGLKTYFSPIMYAMIVLAMVIYGMKLMSAQVQDITKETMNLFFKIALILYFVLSWRDYYPIFFTTIDYINDILISVLTTKDTLTACTVPNSGAMPAVSVFPQAYRNAAISQIVGAPADYSLWFKFDCLIGRLFGAGNVERYALGTSMVAVLGAAIFSGAFGFMLFIVGLTAILAVFFLVMRSILIVMMSFLSLAFAIILAPLFIPLLLFKQTTQYFLKWIFLIFNSIIQPVFVMAFLIFVILLFNELLYEDSSLASGSKGVLPINTILGVSKNSSVNAAYTNPNGMPKKIVKGPIASNIVSGDNEFRNYTGITSRRDSSEKTANCKLNVMTCTGVDITAFSNVSSLNFAEEEKTFTELIINMLAMLFLSYVMLKLLYEIPDIATSICGNVGIGLVRASAVPLNLDTKIAGFIKTAQGVAFGGKGAVGGQQTEGLLNSSGGSAAQAPKGQSKMDAVKFVLKGSATNSAQLQGALGGKGGLIGGTIRGGIDGLRSGGLKGAIKGVMTGGVRGAAGNVKDMVSKGASGAAQSTKKAIKDVAGEGNE